MLWIDDNLIHPAISRGVSTHLLQTIIISQNKKGGIELKGFDYNRISFLSRYKTSLESYLVGKNLYVVTD